MDEQYMQITEFAQKVGKHFTTVNGWFNSLEEKLIHYVSTDPKGKKVYDSLDYEIACYIRDKREKKWSLDAIYEEIPKEFEVRPFPPESEVAASTDVFDPATFGRLMGTITEDLLKKEFEAMRENVRYMIKDEVSHSLEELKHIIKEVQLQQTQQISGLLEQNSKTELEDQEAEKIRMREERINERALMKRVESKLKSDALRKWMEKSPEERFVKVGFFKKVEDVTKRDLFIEDYISSKFEEEYRKQSE